MFEDSRTRTKIDLAGVWEYSVDGNSWKSVKIPSAYDFTGRVFFTRRFDVKADLLDKYTLSLVVYGINYQSEITINGNFVGRHTGGYSSFVVPIAQNTMQVGAENTIRVSVENELNPKTTLPLYQRVGGWRTYGGIFRDIYILATPKLRVDEPVVTATITTEKKTESKSARLEVHSTVVDQDAEDSLVQGALLSFQVEAYNEGSGEIVGRSGLTPVRLQGSKSAAVIADLTISGAALWSPESPSTYLLRCQLVRSVNKEIVVLDEYVLTYGIRDLQWKGGKLFVNDEQLPLRGLLWLEDHPAFGSALSYEMLEQDLSTIKALGVNLIRCLYPPHPYVLTLCDRYGLFVMQEIPLQGVPSEILSQDYYQDLAIGYVKEMVSRDKNHASMLAWGIGNDFRSNGAPDCEFIHTMKNVIQASDDRAIYLAGSSPADRCYEHVDLLAINMSKEEPRTFREQLKKWKGAAGGKPLLIARFGQDVEPGDRSGYSDPFSVEAQARYAMQMHDVIKDAGIAGGILWSYSDWRTDRPALTTRSSDPYMRAMGVVGYDREKRPAYDVMRALLHGDKPQALPVGNYSSSTPVIYVVSGLVILLAFAFMYNGNRRFRDSVNRSLIRTYNFFADVRDQRILTYGHSFFLALIISITWATLMSSILSHYRENVMLDNIVSHFLSDSIKEQFIYLVWNPLRFILVMSAAFFVLLFLLSVLVRILSMLVRTHVHFYHAYSVTMWSMLPYVIFIPVAMILYRLLESNLYIMPVFILLVSVTVWVLIRLFKAVSIIYDVYPIKVYAIGLLIIIVTTVAVYGYFDYTRSTSVYLKYMMQEVNEPSTTDS